MPDPVWDETKPAGAESLQVSDDKIRDNFAYLKDALAREHTFPGTYGGTAGQHKRFGNWTSVLASGSGTRTIGPTQATEDMFITVVIWSGSGGNSKGTIIGRTDAINPPTTIRAYGTFDDTISLTLWVASITLPVKKNEYYKVEINQVAGTVNSYGDKILLFQT